MDNDYDFNVEQEHTEPVAEGAQRPQRHRKPPQRLIEEMH